VSPWKGINQGSKNGNWSENPSYSTIHNWVRSRISKPERCPKCNKNRKLQLSCKDHKYSRDLKLWQYLCQSCHMIEDEQIGRKAYFCKICNKQISYYSGKYGQGRCASCAKSIDQKGRKRNEYNILGS